MSTPYLTAYPDSDTDTDTVIDTDTVSVRDVLNFQHVLRVIFRNITLKRSDTSISKYQLPKIAHLPEFSGLSRHSEFPACYQ